jgi:hypothetical protein
MWYTHNGRLASHKKETVTYNNMAGRCIYSVVFFFLFLAELGFELLGWNWRKMNESSQAQKDNYLFSLI